MSRIRTLKPELLDDAKIATLSHLEFRLFVSCILLADDHGNLRGDSAYLLGTTLHGSRETSRADVEEALETLARVSLLRLYTARSQLYLHIAGWEKHQRVDKPSRPRMPTPADPDSKEISWEYAYSLKARGTLASVVAEPSRDPRETVRPDLRPPTSDPDREQGSSRARACAIPGVGTGTEHAPPSPLPPEPSGSQKPAPSEAHLPLVKRTWDRLNAKRVELAKQRGWRDVRTLHVLDPGRGELASRVLESGANAEADVEHVLAVAFREAEVKNTVRWLSGSMFERRQWSRSLAMQLADVKAPAGDEPAPVRRRERDPNEKPPEPDFSQWRDWDERPTEAKP